MARVLVTRAEPGASATAARLVAKGHVALIAPALRIESLAANSDVHGFQGLLFTSSNGVTAFAAASPDRSLPVWCVGEATAEAAHAAGFAVVHVGAGDVQRLATLVVGSARKDAGPLLHIAGADLAGDLAGALRANGFRVEIRTFYRAVPSTTLPESVAQALASGPPALDAVVFHSARGANAFIAQVKQREALARIDALCLSAAVAETVRGLTWRRVAIAGEPLDSALLALLRAAD